MGRMVLTLLGMVAEMELGSASSVIGNALASMPQSKGVVTRAARPPSIARVVACAQGRNGRSEIARAVGCRRGNLYKALKAAGLN